MPPDSITPNTMLPHSQASTSASSSLRLCLGLILARAGSKGLPDKNILDVAGRPMIAWTIDHARASRRLDAVLVSTDSPAIAQIASRMGIPVIDRPPELASDTATVDAAARHAVLQYEAMHHCICDPIVILYANVPLRPLDLIDRALEKLETTGADSVQSVCPVGKMHPYWMKKLTGPAGDVLEPFIENTVYRRQDLPPLYMLDGGLIALRRASLFRVEPGQPHAFLGTDRRAIVTEPGQVIDVDSPLDLLIARALLQHRGPVRSLTQTD